jgi:hypothetical protein
VVDDIFRYGLTVAIRRHDLFFTPEPLLALFVASFAADPRATITCAPREQLGRPFLVAASQCLCLHIRTTEGNTSAAKLPANTGRGSLFGRSENSAANPIPARV